MFKSVYDHCTGNLRMSWKANLWTVDKDQSHTLSKHKIQDSARTLKPTCDMVIRNARLCTEGRASRNVCCDFNVANERLQLLHEHIGGTNKRSSKLLLSRVMPM